MKKLSYDFVKEKIEKEGYSLLSKEYKNANVKLKVKCDKGHEYKVKYGHFYTGKRCPTCSRPSKKHSYSYIKEQIEKEGYKLLSNEYKGNKNKLKIQCNKGHVFKLSWHKFVIGTRCLICAGNQRHSYDFVKEQIEKEGYKLLSKEYKNAKKIILVKCKEGHVYETTYDRICLGDKGCPKCNPNFSNSEKELFKYLKSLNLKIIENDRSIIPPLELDVVIPEKKLAIEYCGLYWHSEIYKTKNYHLNKLEQCNEAGYRLITIFEDEWLNKQEIVKNRLRYILGLEEKKIYARNCIVKEITKYTAKKFINKYHIQGYSSSSLCLGAFYNNELVAVNTFKKRNNGVYELNRFCTSTNVVGIASKLLKYFQRNYNYEKIITFADRRWSEGNLYEKIGFEKDKELNFDYSYFKGINRFHKFGFRHSIMKNKLENYNPQFSEFENMTRNGWNRIYDCGKIRYVI